MKKIFIIATLLFVGAGCASAEPSGSSVTPSTESQVEAPTSTVWTHPKFGFSFVISNEITPVVGENGIDVTFKDTKEFPVAIMAIQPGIPGIPLPDEKIEKVKLQGYLGHLYHDMDAETGAIAIDKLIVDFPDQSNTVYIAQPVEAGAVFDIKNVIKTWKWKK